MKKILLSFFVMIVLNSCSLVPTYHRPITVLPASWQHQLNANNKKMVEVTENWWTHFHSAELDECIHEALMQNRDLDASLHRIEQARANAQIAGAPLWPNADLRGGVTKLKRFASGTPSRWQTIQNAQLNIAYEVDLWGGNRAALLAANELFAANVFDYDALALITSAEVATTYFDIITAREQIKISKQNLGNARQILTIIDAQFHEGRVSALEQSQQKSLEATQEALLAALQNIEATAINKLAVLLGRPPEAIHIVGRSLSAIHIPNISTIQPICLLVRRPDIARAEAQLISANANIGVARAAFLPSLNLNSAAALVTNPLVKTLSMSASTLAPIFQGGALQGQLAFVTAHQKELAALYQKTILIALQETEDALSAANTAKQRVRVLKTAVVQSRLAYTLSRERYLAGSIDFQTVINTQTELLQTEDRLANAQLDVLTSHVLLFKALGGGWSV